MTELGSSPSPRPGSVLSARASAERTLNPLDGLPLVYRCAGDGDAVLLVHGTALSQAIWRGLGFVRALEQDFRVITMDLRGHGRSGAPHEEAAYRMELLVADTLAVLDAAGVHRAHYVGYSLGARIGYSLLASAPERVGAFVSAAGAPGTRPGAFDRVFFPGCATVLGSGGPDAMRRFLADWEIHRGEPIDASTRAAFLRDDPLALAAYMRESERDAGVSDAQLADIRSPTLLMAGSRDPERLRAAERAAAILPAATLKVLDGADHAATLRHPETLRSIREFLACA